MYWDWVLGFILCKYKYTEKPQYNTPLNIQLIEEIIEKIAQIAIISITMYFLK